MRLCPGYFTEDQDRERPPMLKWGDQVKKKQILALLETMKVFQKVKSPVEGIILEIVAEMRNHLRMVI